MKRSALLIIDVQNDFLPPDGALAVPNGTEVLEPIVSLLSDHWLEQGGWDKVIASQVCIFCYTIEREI